MKIAIVLYEQVTALDFVGPLEVLGRWPGAETHFVATRRGPLHTDSGLQITPSAHTDDLPDPDLILIPGSSRPLDPMGDETLLDWVRAAAPGATWVTSVCTGSGVYAAAGLLAGRRATTHWAFRPVLSAAGAQVVAERVVFDGNLVTAAGVSAGIDMALELTARVHGETAARASQLAIEYDPAPPFDAGTPESAGPEAVSLVSAMLSGSALPA